MNYVMLQTPIERLIEALNLNPNNPHVAEALSRERADFRHAYEAGYEDAETRLNPNLSAKRMSLIEFNEYYGKD
jgi:hypothetical protein